MAKIINFPIRSSRQAVHVRNVSTLEHQVNAAKIHLNELTWTCKKLKNIFDHSLETHIPREDVLHALDVIQTHLEQAFLNLDRMGR